MDGYQRIYSHDLMSMITALGTRNAAKVVSDLVIAVNGH